MPTVPRIVAIGGGDLRKGGTIKIDRHIVELTGKRRPRALFIPTASADNEKYIESFHHVYGKRLGCKTRALTLFADRPNKREMRDMVLGSDLIYVGGGNTSRMMRLWRRLGLDTMIRTALRKGVVGSGLSAGGICWFRHGHSDSRKKPGRKTWDSIRVGALGVIPATFCPHYHAERREKSLRKMVREYGGITLACDNNAAIEFAGTQWCLLTSKRGAKAYRVLRRRGRTVTEPLPNDREFRPLDDLLDRDCPVE